MSLAMRTEVATQDFQMFRDQLTLEIPHESFERHPTQTNSTKKERIETKTKEYHNEIHLFS